MNTHETDHQDHHDEELNALLASLPQPAPSSALDAAILADAEKALQQPVAANDSADGALRTLPAKKAPDYLQRWRVPLGLAAAVLLTVNLIGVDWFGSKPAQFPVIGEPVTPEVTPISGASAIASVPPPAEAPPQPAALPAAPAPAPAPRALAKIAPRPTPQADPAPLTAPPAPPPPPAPATAMPEAMAQQVTMKAESGLQRQVPVQRALTMPPPAKLDASVWLVKIDALLKAGEGGLAQQEWMAFRQAYPDYPVAEELRQRLEKQKQ
jgi:Meckel syndrome type 1 protein